MKIPLPFTHERDWSRGFDPLLPGWLVHLLRERAGQGAHTHPDIDGEWDVWAERADPPRPHMAWRRLASGPTEIAALVAALNVAAP